MINVAEIKKDLYKTKAIAKLMYYDPANGDLMYSIEALGKTWVFPIHTVQPDIKELGDPTLKVEKKEFIQTGLKLTDDLKGARFEPEMRGSSLIRWIEQAIKRDEFH